MCLKALFHDILKAVLVSVQLSTLIEPSPPNYNQKTPNPKPQNKQAKKRRKTHYQQLPELCFSILGMVKAQPTCIGSFVIPLHKNYLTTATDLKSSSSHCYAGSHIKKKKVNKGNDKFCKHAFDCHRVDWDFNTLKSRNVSAYSYQGTAILKRENKKYDCCHSNRTITSLSFKKRH